MKVLIYNLLTIGFFCMSCTLKRDNPLDGHASPTSSLPSSNTTVSGMRFSKYSVAKDNNANGVVNFGESIEMKVYLKNKSANIISGVQAKITTNSSYVSNLNPSTQPYTYNYSYQDDIPPGKETDPGGYPSSTLFFNLSSSTPPGAILSFFIEITDQANSLWRDTFYVNVVPTSANIEFSKYQISSDNNGDGVANSGEGVNFKLYLKNTGSSQANNVKAIVKYVGTNLISFSSDTQRYTYNYSYQDDLPPGKESDNGGYPNSTTFSIFFNAFSTKVPQYYPFIVYATDESNNRWQDTFSITAYPTSANIEFSKVVVTSDDNSNGLLESGENANLRIYLKNIGTSKAMNISGTISCSNIFVTTGPGKHAFTYSYGYEDAIPAGKESDFGDYPGGIPITVSASVPSGTVLTFTINISDGSYNTWTDNFNLTVH